MFTADRILFILFILITLQIGCRYCTQYDENAKKDILDYHNSIRSQVAKGTFTVRGNIIKPTGTNMQKMNWNNDLALSAETYALTDPHHHSSNHNVGENLFWHLSTKPGNLNKYGKMAGESWIKEFQDLEWNRNILDRALFETGVGHATQMVWANTTQVGCAYSSLPAVHKQTGRKVTRINVVCHYTPKGNYINQPIYIEGPICSQCSMFERKCETSSGLCI